MENSISQDSDDALDLIQGILMEDFQNNFLPEEQNEVLKAVEAFKKQLSLNAGKRFFNPYHYTVAKYECQISEKFTEQSKCGQTSLHFAQVGVTLHSLLVESTVKV